MERQNAKFEILSDVTREDILRNLEIAGRTCYKSEDRITEESAPKFVKMLVKRYHVSVLEHVSISVRFTIDRGVQQELTRHRHASYSIESTRYIKYNEGIKVISPEAFMSEEAFIVWQRAMQNAENSYKILLDLGVKPEIARDVLPLSLSSEVVMTMNLRAWMEMLEQRVSKAAHPQIREVMIPLLERFQEILPEIFEHVKIK